MRDSCLNIHTRLNVTIMKAIIIALLPVVIAASGCSADEEPQQKTSETSHEISFYATAPKSTRAASTTTATLQNFVVFAYTDASVIMNGVTVSREEGRGHILLWCTGRLLRSISML